MEFIAHHPKATIDHMGLIPIWLSNLDPRPAKEQLHERYAHGGGWRPFNGFTMNDEESLCYPDDPPQPKLCEIQLRNERIVMYPHSWVAIIQPNGSFEVCRMD